MNVVKIILAGVGAIAASHASTHYFQYNFFDIRNQIRSSFFKTQKGDSRQTQSLSVDVTEPSQLEKIGGKHLMFNHSERDKLLRDKTMSSDTTVTQADKQEPLSREELDAGLSSCRLKANRETSPLQIEGKQFQLASLDRLRGQDEMTAWLPDISG